MMSPLILTRPFENAEWRFGSSIDAERRSTSGSPRLVTMTRSPVRATSVDERKAFGFEFGGFDGFGHRCALLLI